MVRGRMEVETPAPLGAGSARPGRPSPHQGPEFPPPGVRNAGRMRPWGPPPSPPGISTRSLPRPASGIPDLLGGRAMPSRAGLFPLLPRVHRAVPSRPAARIGPNSIRPEPKIFPFHTPPATWVHSTVINLWCAGVCRGERRVICASAGYCMGRGRTPTARANEDEEVRQWTCVLSGWMNAVPRASWAPGVT